MSRRLRQVSNQQNEAIEKENFEDADHLEVVILELNETVTKNGKIYVINFNSLETLRNKLTIVNLNMLTLKERSKLFIKIKLWFTRTSLEILRI